LVHYSTKATMIKKILLIIILMVLFASYASATDWYVRDGATGAGNGTTRADAWDNFSNIDWASVGAEDTIYVDAGTYGTLSIGQSGTSAIAPTYIKKSTIADHGDPTGWDDAYAATATITGFGGGSQGIYASGRSYVVVDGQFADGFTIIMPANDSCSSTAYGVRITTASDNIILKYIKIDGSADHEAGRGLYLAGTNFTIQNVWLAYFCNDPIQVLTGSGHVFDGIEIGPKQSSCVASACCSGNLCHGDMVEIAYGGTTSNVTVKNSLFHYNADGIHFLGTGGSHDGWKIYNNIFTSSGGVKINSADPVVTNSLIYNNTFISSAGIGPVYSVTFDIHNNLFYLPSAYGLDTGDNLTADTDPFVDAAGGNFQLKPTETTLIGQGTTLGSPYNVDKAGTARPDGAYDIGAYQHTSGSTPGNMTMGSGTPNFFIGSGTPNVTFGN